MLLLLNMEPKKIHIGFQASKKPAPDSFTSMYFIFLWCPCVAFWAPRGIIFQ